MTKKKKPDNSLAHLLFFVALGVFLLILACAPLYLIGGLIYFYFRYKLKYSKLKNNMADFWLTSNEKIKFKELVNQINEADDEIYQSKKEARSNDLSVNLNGRLSAKSSMGKELQNIIDKYSSIKIHATRELDILKSKPIVAWFELNKLITKIIGFIISIFVYLLLAVIISQIPYFDVTLDRILAFGYFLFIGLSETEREIGFFKYFGDGHIIQAMALITIVSYFVLDHFKNENQFGERITNKITPKPSELTIENIDQF
jgi:hypothetical protein